jgi:hypothetical protein
VVFSRAIIKVGKEELLDGSYLTPAFLLPLMRFRTGWADTVRHRKCHHPQVGAEVIGDYMQIAN